MHVQGCHALPPGATCRLLDFKPRLTSAACPPGLPSPKQTQLRELERFFRYCSGLRERRPLPQRHYFHSVLSVTGATGGPQGWGGGSGGVVRTLHGNIPCLAAAAMQLHGAWRGEQAPPSLARR